MIFPTYHETKGAFAIGRIRNLGEKGKNKFEDENIYKNFGEFHLRWSRMGI